MNQSSRIGPAPLLLGFPPLLLHPHPLHPFYMGPFYGYVLSLYDVPY